MTSSDTAPEKPILRWEWGLLAVAACTFVLIRLPLYTNPGRILGWNSDAAIFGLMARAMRDGIDVPIYFWGQSYLGTLTSLLTVITGALVGIGPLALRMAAAIEVALGAVFFWLGLRAAFDRAAAAMVLLWLAAGPSFLFHFTIAPIGAEQLFLVAGVLFWYATRMRADRAGEWFVLGMITGFGTWLHQGILFVAAGIGIALIATHRFRMRWIGIGALGFLIGYSPAGLSLLRDDPLLYRRTIPDPNRLRVLENITETLRSDLWLLLADSSAIGMAVGACVVLLAIVALRGAPRTRAQVTILGTIAVSAAFWLLSTYAYPGAVRYIVPVVPLLYGAAAAGIVRWWKAGNARRVAASAAAMIILLGLWIPRMRQANDVAAGRSERYVDWPGFFDPRPTLEQLRNGGFQVCYGEVWVAHKLEWLTSPTVRFVPVRSVHRTLNQSLALIRQPGRKCHVDNDGQVRPLTAAEESHWAATVIERTQRAGFTGPRFRAPAPVSAPPVQAVISGEVYQVLDVGNATEVSLWLGDDACNPVELVGRVFANAEGKFEVAVPQGRCVIAEATGGGARGRTNMRSTSPRFPMVIRMDPPPPLTRVEADALAAALRAAVNENSESVMHTLASHVIAQDIDSVRIGIDHLRIWLGDIVSTKLTDERHEQNFDEFVYEVAGSKGPRTTLRIQQGPRRVMFTPLLQLGARASRYVSTFARLVTENDAEKLARFLTADDVDYPVEKARAMIQRYDALREMESARPILIGIDEEKSTLRYVIEGRKKDGTPVSIPIEIGYGDGMLWVRE